MARGPLPRLPALAAAPRLHPSPRGRRGGRAHSLADSSAGLAGLRAAAFAAATESWGRPRRGLSLRCPQKTAEVYVALEAPSRAIGGYQNPGDSQLAKHLPHLLGSAVHER